MGQDEPGLQAALALLGLGADADADQVRRAYRRLALATHPDVSPTADAAARFDALTRAHRLVSEAVRPPEGFQAPADGAFGDGVPPLPPPVEAPPTEPGDSP